MENTTAPAEGVLDMLQRVPMWLLLLAAVTFVFGIIVLVFHTNITSSTFPGRQFPLMTSANSSLRIAIPGPLHRS